MSTNDEDERRPLLARVNDAPVVPQQDEASLPWLQITIICIWRASHALYFGYILTWITRFLIREGHATTDNVGTVAGWIESAYSLGVLTGLAPASYISDSIGRKPTAIMGCLGASIATSSFGFATTVPQLVAIRFIMGLCIAFLPATVMTMLIEKSTPATQPTVFAVNGFAWTVGALAAPFIGGFSAEAAEQYPSIFGNTIWARYPYALPGVLVAIVPLFTSLISICIVEETLAADQKRPFFGHRRRGDSAGNEARQQRTAPASGLFTKPVCFSLGLWALFVFLAVGFMVTEVLFLSSPRSAGGLGFKPRQMGILYGVRPLFSNLVQLFIYPPLARRYPIEQLLRWSTAVSLVVVYLAYFAFGMVASYIHPTTSTSTIILFVLSVPMAVNSITGTASMQTLSSRAPSKQYLTRINTLAEYASNSGHGLAAIVASNIWSISATRNLLHGQASWLFLLGCSIALTLSASRLTHVSGWRDASEEE